MINKQAVDEIVLIDIWEPLKIAFVTKMSEMMSGKEVGQNPRRRSNSYIEDDFGSPTKHGGIVAICSRN